MRRLELWIQILEINENGDFVPVEVVPARDVETGGIFQLRQVGIIQTGRRQMVDPGPDVDRVMVLSGPVSTL